VKLTTKIVRFSTVKHITHHFTGNKILRAWKIQFRLHNGIPDVKLSAYCRQNLLIML